MKLFLFSLTLFFITPIIDAQSPYIHAQKVGEWGLQEDLPPEYHYNSVSVFLLNEDKLATLFDPNGLSKEQRKKTGIKLLDKVESLFFQLEIPNPKEVDESLLFPLYAFDLTPSTSFKPPRSHGKILDRISDEELNGQSLDAIARIEMVSKNELLEVAYKISSSINTLLGNQLFRKPDIWQTMQKAQQFFESRYRGKMVAEFSIPILPEDETYEYIIKSASLYQVKWDFQEAAVIYKDNVWFGLDATSAISVNHLRDKPTRLSKLKKHPFLLVVHYKSAYTLPKIQQLNVSFTEEYLEKRRYNLQEFRNGTIPYKTEEQFVTLLSSALSLRKDIEQYLNAKKKGQIDNEKLLAIAEAYYQLLSEYERNKTQLNEEEKQYFNDFYKITYFKFFKKIEHFLLQDPQIKSISQIPTHLENWIALAKDSLSELELYQFLEQFQSYRQYSLETDSIHIGSLSFLVAEKTLKIEQRLFDEVWKKAPYSQEETLDFLAKIKQQYPHCNYCKTQAIEREDVLKNKLLEEAQLALQSLQYQQLKYGRCFASLHKKVASELENQFPDSTALDVPEQELYQVLTEKVESMSSLASQFMTISDIKFEKLALEEAKYQLSHYKGIIYNYKQHVCSLSQAGMLPKEDVECIAGICKTAIP